MQPVCTCVWPCVFVVCAGRRLLAQGQSLAEPRLTHIPEAQATLRPAYTASMQQSHHSQRRTHDTPRHAAQPQDSPSTRATVDSDHTPSRPADTVQQQRRRLQKTKADSDKDIGIATNREGKHGRQRRQPRRRQPARRRRAVDAGPLSAAGAAAFDAMWARMREAIGLAATAAVPHLRHAGSVNRSILRQEAALWSSQVDGMGGLGPTLRDDNTTQSRDAGGTMQVSSCSVLWSTVQTHTHTHTHMHTLSRACTRAHTQTQTQTKCGAIVRRCL